MLSVPAEDPMSTAPKPITTIRSVIQIPRHGPLLNRATSR
jgi:hypothetical protein